MQSTQVNQNPALPGVFGPLKGANGNARITGPCGDTMEFWVQIHENRIHRCTFTTDGCSDSVACGTAACTLAAGAPETVAYALEPADVLALLPGFPEESGHCALLATTTLRATISDYHKKPTGEIEMKIAIPTANEKLCMHFGHCETFAVLTVDEQTKKITGREDLIPPPHEPGVLPAWLHEQGVNLILAGGMGQRAQQLFAQNDIQVVVGAPSSAPEELVRSWMDGTLTSGANACDH